MHCMRTKRKGKLETPQINAYGRSNTEERMEDVKREKRDGCRSHKGRGRRKKEASQVPGES